MRLRFGVAALTAAGLLLTACTSDTGEVTDVGSVPPADATGTLTVWLMQGSQTSDVIEAVNEAFAEEYPDVEVNVELQQWAGIQEKLTASLDTDTTPDVVEIGNSLTARYADAGLLADLSAYAEDFDVEAMLPGLQPPGVLDGARYGIPYYGGVRVVVYNKAQFEKAGAAVPKSLAELEKAAAALQEANSDNDAYSAFYFPGRYWTGAVPFIWEAGGEIATQEGETWTGALDQPEAVAGLTTLKGLVEKYSKAPVDSDETKNLEAFQTGNVGMMIDSWWAPGALDTGDLQGDVGAFALPGSQAGTTSPVYFGGSDLAVSARSAQQALGVQWMQILTGTEVQTLLASAGVIPNQEAAFAGHRGNPFMVAADTAATNSRFTPVSPNWPYVESAQVLPEMLVSILSNDRTVEVATAEASGQIASILNS